MALKISTKRFVLSDETKNLYGFVTVTAGIDLSAFQENPVMLYNHDYDRLIGQWVDWRFENKQLTAAPGFDENDPFAMQQYSKVEEGILKGASVGISPVNFDEVLGRMSACLLLEASLTPVPNNKNALAIYSAKGQKLSATEVKQYLLSVTPSQETLTNKNNMNLKFITALVALCVQAGHTITLSAESKDEEVESAISKVGATITELKQSKVDLSAQVKKLNDEKDAAAEKSISDRLTEAVNKKLLSAEAVPGLKALAKTDLNAFNSILNNLNPVEIRTAEVNQDKGTTKTELSGDKATWKWDDFASKAPKELEEMEITNPELFKKLSAEKIASVRSNVSIPV